MKTPTDYTKKLNSGIITYQMLTDCLYSVSKRAKTTETKKENISITDNVVNTISIIMKGKIVLKKNAITTLKENC